MKLVQRVVIGYYKTKIKTIGLVSHRKAAEVAFRLFCTPNIQQSKHKAPPVFHKAHRLAFELDGLTIRGFQWKPEHPNGKKILIVHGFSSYSYKFENYIPLLAKDGFEVVAFDAPAHGLSGGKQINAVLYKNTLLQIEALYGPVDGIIAHSLGGLAAALALEEMKNGHAKKMVLIAPATETSSAVTGFYRLLNIHEATRKEFEQLILGLAGQPINYFSVTRAIQQIATPTLWIHDKKDSICPYKDSLPAQQLNLPTLRFIITEGLGHNKIYRDQAVIKEVLQFLAV